MTRNEQLQFCKKCTNRKMDFQGLICSLTGEKANFEETCPDFKIDAAEETRLEERAHPNATSEAGKSADKPGVGTLLIGILLIVRGGMRLAQGQVAFGAIMLLVGVSSLIYYLSNLASN
jgi:hypothetical protein